MSVQADLVAALTETLSALQTTVEAKHGRKGDPLYEALYHPGNLGMGTWKNRDEFARVLDRFLRDPEGTQDEPWKDRSRRPWNPVIDGGMKPKPHGFNEGPPVYSIWHPDPKLQSMFGDSTVWIPSGKTEPIKYVYRSMTDAEFQEALKRGYIQSDQRGCIIPGWEGTNAAVTRTSALAYLPNSDIGRIVKIKVDPKDGWFTSEADSYLRTRGKVPVSAIVAATPPIFTDPHGNPITKEWMDRNGMKYPTDEKARHVRTPEGERRFGQPIGTVIAADAQLLLPHMPHPRLRRVDAERLKHPDVRAKRLRAAEDTHEAQRLMSEAWNDEGYFYSEDNPANATLNEKYGLHPDDAWNGVEDSDWMPERVSDVVATTEWTKFGPCRDIREAAYDLLGYDVEDQSQTAADSNLRGPTPQWGGGDDRSANPHMFAYALMEDLNSAPRQNRPLYRGLAVGAGEQQDYIDALRQGDTFDMPLASFTDQRDVAERFTGIGGSVHAVTIFVLQKNARALNGGAMVDTSEYTDPNSEKYDEWFDPENDGREWITGGRFKVMSVHRTTRKDVSYETTYIYIKQTATFDPSTGLAVKRDMTGKVCPMWVSFVPLSQQGPRPKNETKDVVRTPAGRRRFGLPIGTHIPGTPYLGGDDVRPRRPRARKLAVPRRPVKKAAAKKVAAKKVAKKAVKKAPAESNLLFPSGPNGSYTPDDFYTGQTLTRIVQRGPARYTATYENVTISDVRNGDLVFYHVNHDGDEEEDVVDYEYIDAAVLPFERRAVKKVAVKKVAVPRGNPRFTLGQSYDIELRDGTRVRNVRVDYKDREFVSGRTPNNEYYSFVRDTIASARRSIPAKKVAKVPAKKAPIKKAVRRVSRFNAATFEVGRRYDINTLYDGWYYNTEISRVTSTGVTTAQGSHISYYHVTSVRPIPVLRRSPSAVRAMKLPGGSKFKPQHFTFRSHRKDAARWHYAIPGGLYQQDRQFYIEKRGSFWVAAGDSGWGLEEVFSINKNLDVMLKDLDDNIKVNGLHPRVTPGVLRTRKNGKKPSKDIEGYYRVPPSIAGVVEEIDSGKIKSKPLKGKLNRSGEYINLSESKADPEIIAASLEFAEMSWGDWDTVIDFNSSYYTGDELSAVGVVIYKGKQVGTFSRSLYLDRKEMHNNELVLDRKYTGQGFAEQFYGWVETHVKQHGIEKVSVDANIDVGGYAWTRRGFGWNPASFRWEKGNIVDRVRTAKHNLEARHSYQDHTFPVTTAQQIIRELEEIERRFDAAGDDVTKAPTPEELALVGSKARGGKWVGRVRRAYSYDSPGKDVPLWVGKAMMLGSAWGGIKPLGVGVPEVKNAVDDYMKRVIAAIPAFEADYTEGDYWGNAEKSDLNVMGADLYLDVDDIETKGAMTSRETKTRVIRRVRTKAGEKFFGLPIGSVIGFTGTSHGGMTDAQRKKVEQIVKGMKPSMAHHGDAIGADTDFHKIARKLKVRIHTHPSNLPAAKRGNNTGADIASRPKPPLERNKDIVARAGVMIATPAGMTEERRSGTWATIREARRTNTPLIIVFPDGSVKMEGAPAPTVAPKPKVAAPSAPVVTPATPVTATPAGDLKIRWEKVQHPKILDLQKAILPSGEWYHVGNAGTATKPNWRVWKNDDLTRKGIVFTRGKDRLAAVQWIRDKHKNDVVVPIGTHNKTGTVWTTEDDKRYQHSIKLTNMGAEALTKLHQGAKRRDMLEWRVTDGHLVTDSYEGYLDVLYRMERSRAIQQKRANDTSLPANTRTHHRAVIRMYDKTTETLRELHSGTSMVHEPEPLNEMRARSLAITLIQNSGFDRESALAKWARSSNISVRGEYTKRRVLADVHAMMKKMEKSGQDTGRAEDLYDYLSKQRGTVTIQKIPVQHVPRQHNWHQYRHPGHPAGEHIQDTPMFDVFGNEIWLSEVTYDDPSRPDKVVNLRFTRTKYADDTYSIAYPDGTIVHYATRREANAAASEWLKLNTPPIPMEAKIFAGVLKDIADALETKVRHVIDADYWGMPVGTPLTEHQYRAHPRLRIAHMVTRGTPRQSGASLSDPLIAHPSKFEDFEFFKDADGREFYVGEVPGFGWIATQGEDFNTWPATGTSRSAVLRELRAYVHRTAQPPAAPAHVAPTPAKKTPAKRARKITAPKHAAKKTPAKKTPAKAPARPVAAKKTPARPKPQMKPRKPSTARTAAPKAPVTPKAKVWPLTITKNRDGSEKVVRKSTLHVVKKTGLTAGQPEMTFDVKQRGNEWVALHGSTVVHRSPTRTGVMVAIERHGMVDAPDSAAAAGWKARGNTARAIAAWVARWRGDPMIEGAWEPTQHGRRIPGYHYATYEERREWVGSARFNVWIRDAGWETKPDRDDKPVAYSFDGRVPQRKYTPEHDVKASHAKHARVDKFDQAAEDKVNTYLRRNWGVKRNLNPLDCALLVFMRQGMRPGGGAEQGKGRTYGATTLQRRHVFVDEAQDHVILRFKGKTYKDVTLVVSDPDLVKMFKTLCTGPDLKNPDDAFIDIEKDPAGIRRSKSDTSPLFPSITSNDIQRVLRTETGIPDLLTKDMRTYQARILAMNFKAHHRPPRTEPEAKKLYTECAELVAAQLGNKASQARKSYINMPKVFADWVKPGWSEPK